MSQNCQSVWKETKRCCRSQERWKSNQVRADPNRSVSLSLFLSVSFCLSISPFLSVCPSHWLYFTLSLFWEMLISQVALAFARSRNAFETGPVNSCTVSFIEILNRLNWNRVNLSDETWQGNEQHNQNLALRVPPPPPSSHQVIDCWLTSFFLADFINEPTKNVRNAMKDAASTTCRSYFNNGTDIQNRGNAPPSSPPRPTSLLLLHCRWYYCWTNRCAMGRENYCIKKKAAMVRRDCCSLPIGNIDMLLADVQMKAGLYQLQWSNSLFDASSCSSAIKQWPSSFLHSICCFRFLKPINSSVASTWVTSRSRFLFFFFHFS